MESVTISAAGIQSISWSAVPETVVHGSISRKVLHTDKLTIIRYEFAPGAIYPLHQHPESQVTLVLSGALTFDYGDRVERHCAGDLVVIPSNIPHEGRAEEGPTVILCVFVPPRHEAIQPPPGANS